MTRPLAGGLAGALALASPWAATADPSSTIPARLAPAMSEPGQLVVFTAADCPADVEHEDCALVFFECGDSSNLAIGVTHLADEAAGRWLLDGMTLTVHGLPGIAALEAYRMTRNSYNGLWTANFAAPAVPAGESVQPGARVVIETPHGAFAIPTDAESGDALAAILAACG